MRTNGRMEEQTDMTKPIVAFRNFVNVPKNIYSYLNNDMRFDFHRSVRILGYFRLYIKSVF